MKESVFKSNVISKLKDMFPGCEIIQADPSYQQGILDTFIFWNSYWGALEFKKSEQANRQPNQDYYVERLNGMSFASYIFPENEEEVLNALEQAFASPRRTRVFKS